MAGDLLGNVKSFFNYMFFVRNVQLESFCNINCFDNITLNINFDFLLSSRR